MALLIVAGLLLLLLLLLRIVVVRNEIRRARTDGQWPRRSSTSRRPTRNSNNNTTTTHSPVTTLVVLGSGGHTTEMLALIEPLLRTPSSSRHYDFVYCKADTDTTSAARLLHATSTTTLQPSQSTTTAETKKNPIVVYNIPRSREVGQSYFTSLYTTLHAFIWSMWLVLFQIRPGLVLCNGPGTCLPIVVAVLFGRITYLLPNSCPVVFVESLCRVHTLSLTGHLLYPIVDFFGVHWDELHNSYPLSTRCQGFVRSSHDHNNHDDNKNNNND